LQLSPSKTTAAPRLFVVTHSGGGGRGSGVVVAFDVTDAQGALDGGALALAALDDEEVGDGMWWDGKEVGDGMLWDAGGWGGIDGLQHGSEKALL
jgi:hypothetical protein